MHGGSACSSTGPHASLDLGLAKAVLAPGLPRNPKTPSSAAPASEPNNAALPNLDFGLAKAVLAPGLPLNAEHALQCSARVKAKPRSPADLPRRTPQRAA